MNKILLATALILSLNLVLINSAKLGGCPTVDEGTFGICVNECRFDENCSGNQKCCFNGCGFTCQDPVLPVTRPPGPKPGRCPNTDGQIGICVLECNRDSECSGSQKCCSNGCGRVCRDPEQ